MSPGDVSLFVEMARHAPVRTAIYSFGPPLWGLAQLANAYLNDGPLHYVCGFVVLLVVCSVLITRYHAATYRRRLLSAGIDG